MIARVASRLAKAYGLLFFTAAGGLVGANLTTLLAPMFVADHRAAQLAPWVHVGWTVGAALFLFGALTRKLRVISSSFFGLTPAPPTGSDAGGPIRKRVRRLKQPRSEHEAHVGRSVGVPTGIVLGTVGGALIGGFLGGSFLLFWLSFAASPFAPASWASSVAIERQPTPVHNRRDRAVPTTRHPIPLGLFFGPVALGAAAGAIFGGGCAAQGKFVVS
jgi:hypothetical protein